MTFAKSKELFLHITNVATSQLKSLKWVLGTYALKDAIYYSLKTVKMFFVSMPLTFCITLFLLQSQQPNQGQIIIPLVRDPRSLSDDKTKRSFEVHHCTKAKLLQLKLIHIFARAILLMKKLEIEKTKPTFISSISNIFSNKTPMANKQMSFSSSNSALA